MVFFNKENNRNKIYAKNGDGVDCFKECLATCSSFDHFESSHTFRRDSTIVSSKEGSGKGSFLRKKGSSKETFLTDEILRTPN